MKTKIFITIFTIFILIISLAFYVGCDTTNDPAAPGGNQDYVGTWVEILPGSYKEIFTFNIDTFVYAWYDWIVDTWVLDVTTRGSLSVSGDVITIIESEVSFDGINWTPSGPFTSYFNYSISSNQMTLSIGGLIYGVYTKQ